MAPVDKETSLMNLDEQYLAGFKDLRGWEVLRTFSPFFLVLLKSLSHSKTTLLRWWRHQVRRPELWPWMHAAGRQRTACTCLGRWYWRRPKVADVAKRKEIGKSQKNNGKNKNSKLFPQFRKKHAPVLPNKKKSCHYFTMLLQMLTRVKTKLFEDLLSLLTLFCSESGYSSGCWSISQHSWSSTSTNSPRV